MPNKTNWQDRMEIVRLREQGLSNREIARQMGLTEQWTSKLYHSTLKRITRSLVRQGANIAAKKSVESLKTLDTLDKDDRKFALEAFKVFADRDGMSPQAAIQVNNQVNVAVVQPLVASQDQEDLRRVLKGEEE